MPSRTDLGAGTAKVTTDIQKIARNWNTRGRYCHADDNQRVEHRRSLLPSIRDSRAGTLGVATTIQKRTRGWNKEPTYCVGLQKGTGERGGGGAGIKKLDETLTGKKKILIHGELKIR